MPYYQQILLTINYSETSQIVIAKASSLAKTLSANLSLVHILDNIAMPDTPYGTRINLDEEGDYSLLESEKDRLKILADHLGIQHENVWLIWGQPEQEIANLAKQQNIDLIIAGYHKHHGLLKLFGNTANGLLHQANCDLLTIHID